MVEALGRRHLMLFSGRASSDLAGEVASYLGIECGSVELRNFANGETYARFQESVRGTDAFVIQTHSAPVNERIMEQLIMIDALKRGSAKRISAVVPYYGYSRQDKKGRSREPITAKLVADLLLGAGADRIITIDLHSGQIQGFFDGPVDHLTALPVLADYISENYPGELVVVAPDAGRVKAAEKLAGILAQSLAFLHKRRNRDVAHQVEVREVVGEVQGRHCVMIDDIIDTAGTIVKGAEALMANGAERVIAAATHGIFSGPAIDRLKNAPISEVVVTNTLPVPEEQRLDKIVVLSIAKILADAIRAVFEDASVSEIFNDQNQV
ncbi:MAG TPA: ribose-phosphate diphosphokinase [Actinomycetes bacterium]|jgi:ribose-phosphate pyrophosphokinase|nr:ribose-phosphate diphosphokinase [Actinomycetes bacterium]